MPQNSISLKTLTNRTEKDFGKVEKQQGVAVTYSYCLQFSLMQVQVVLPFQELQTFFPH